MTNLTNISEWSDAELDAWLHEKQGAKWLHYLEGVGPLLWPADVVAERRKMGWKQAPRPTVIRESHLSQIAARYTQDLAAAFALMQKISKGQEVEFLITVDGNATTVESTLVDEDAYNDEMSNNPARGIAEACALAMEAQTI